LSSSTVTSCYSCLRSAARGDYGLVGDILVCFQCLFVTAVTFSRQLSLKQLTYNTGCSGAAPFASQCAMMRLRGRFHSMVAGCVPFDNLRLAPVAHGSRGFLFGHQN
jgi:hypothetical protein